MNQLMNETLSTYSPYKTGIVVRDLRSKVLVLRYDSHYTVVCVWEVIDLV